MRLHAYTILNEGQEQGKFWSCSSFFFSFPAAIPPTFLGPSFPSQLHAVTPPTSGLSLMIKRSPPPPWPQQTKAWCSPPQGTSQHGAILVSKPYALHPQSASALGSWPEVVRNQHLGQMEPAGTYSRKESKAIFAFQRWEALPFPTRGYLTNLTELHSQGGKYTYLGKMERGHCRCFK